MLTLVYNGFHNICRRWPLADNAFSLLNAFTLILLCRYYDTKYHKGCFRQWEGYSICISNHCESQCTSLSKLDDSGKWWRPQWASSLYPPQSLGRLLVPVSLTPPAFVTTYHQYKYLGAGHLHSTTSQLRVNHHLWIVTIWMAIPPPLLEHSFINILDHGS